MEIARTEFIEENIGRRATIKKTGKETTILKCAIDYYFSGAAQKRYLLEGRGRRGGTIPKGKCVTCQQPILEVVPNAQWYDDYMIEIEEVENGN